MTLCAPAGIRLSPEKPKLAYPWERTQIAQALRARRAK